MMAELTEIASDRRDDHVSRSSKVCQVVRCCLRAWSDNTHLVQLHETHSTRDELSRRVARFTCPNTLPVNRRPLSRAASSRTASTKPLSPSLLETAISSFFPGCVRSFVLKTCSQGRRSQWARKSSFLSRSSLDATCNATRHRKQCGSGMRCLPLTAPILCSSHTSRPSSLICTRSSTAERWSATEARSQNCGSVCASSRRSFAIESSSTHELMYLSARSVRRRADAFASRNSATATKR